MGSVHGCPGSRPARTAPGATLSHARRIARPALAGPLASALAGGARVLLTAEAGYGKTALLDEALALLDRDAVRLSGRDLCSDDADLGSALAAGAIVVLDDAGELRADVGTLPQALLESPSGAAVVLSGRRALGLALGRLRADGRLVELGAAELAFNARECEELLRSRLGRDPVAHEVERIMEVTEGWPFGVGLAAARPPAGLLRADGDEALAFLREEVLDQLDPAVRVTLMDAAMPARLDAAMAGALGLDLEAVAGLARLGVFLRPCGPRGRAYRFHPTFRTLLRRTALAERPATDVAAVHSRVAEALAGEGWSPAAFEHWLGAGAWRAALEAVEGAGPALVAVGAEELERWRHRLPLEAGGSLGDSLLEGAQACASGHPEHAVAPLSAAVQAARDAGHDGAEWTARALLASALMALGEAEHAADTARGFDGPAGWQAGPAAPAAAMSAAVALAAAGRGPESHALALAALRHPDGAGLTGFEHLRQAQLDQPRGRLDSALARVRSALAALDGDDPLGQRPMLLACAAALLGEQGLDDHALSTWELAAGAAAARGDRRLVAAAWAQRAALHARAGRLAEAELALGRAESAPATSQGALHEAAWAPLASAQGDAGDALDAAARAVPLAETGPLPTRLSLAATLAPLVAY